MLRGVSGFYAYAIFDHMMNIRPSDVRIDEARLAFKLQKTM